MQDPRTQRITRTWRAIALIAVLLSAGCAATMGQRAATGAARGLQDAAGRVDPEATGPVFERASRGVVTGALSELSKPAQQEALQEAVAAASTSALEALAGSLRANGVLRDDLEGVTRALSASAAAGVRDELANVFPQCTGPERADCVIEQIAVVSQAASRGMARGFLDELQLLLVGLAFALGALLALVLARAWSPPARLAEAT